ncbi:hypothetical protein [Sporosarcina sp. SAFN-010]|uniref:hypothetical protein n=1 Tax=Sporosarcina sp. SAFN-010 TaxID=3387273 RepID=UPI003F7D2AB7
MDTNEMDFLGPITRPPTILERQKGTSKDFHVSTIYGLGARTLEKLINQNLLDEVNLLDSSRFIGKENVTALINERIHNDRFTVELDFSESEEPIIMGQYVGYSMQVHELMIPKHELGLPTEEDIDKVFDLACLGNVDEQTMSYKVFLNETWDANTIGQIVKGINCYLGPFVEKGAKKLKMEDYRMVFRVGVCF